MDDKRDVVNEILTIFNDQAGQLAGSALGASWAGRDSGLRSQLSSAVEAFITRDDPGPLLGMIELMQTMSIVSGPKTETLRNALQS